MERKNGKIWWTFLLSVPSKLFTQILLFSLLLKYIFLKKEVCKRGKRKHIHLKRNVIPFFPSIRTRDVFYEPNPKTQAPLPFTLVQMFLLICLLLGLTVLTAPVRTKKERYSSEWVSYFETSSVFSTCWDLSCLHLPRPVLGSSPTTAHDTTHTYQRGKTLLSPNCSKCYWPQQSSKGNTNLFASRHLKKETKPCISATFPSKVYLQFWEKKGSNCLLALSYMDLNATAEVFW